MLETKNKIMKMIESETGRVGYLVAWMLGVPVSVLFLIFLIRGH